MSQATRSKPTKAAVIAERLRADITAGRFAPGASLDETVVAAQYGVSRTPIREAIRQLTASGMLETRAHRGAMVRAFDERQLDEMFAVMADLEALCARGAALAMTAAEITALEGLLETSLHVVKDDDRSAYAALNQRFHDAVYRGAHNDCLMQLTVDMRTRLAPFRQAQFGAADRPAHSLREHRRVVAAIADRDAGAAFDAMRAHIVVVREAVDHIDVRDDAGDGGLHTS